MSFAKGEREALRLFADLLDYPSPEIADRARACHALVTEYFPEVAPLVRQFQAFVEATPSTRLEELYTGFFDLNPVCHPYVGYQLFGETYKRSAFLLGLKERFREQGVPVPEGELPDRLSVLLQFLAHSVDDVAEEIILEGLIPALDRLTQSQRNNSTAGTSDEVSSGEPELEGHSQGEILKGGFVLELTEADHPAESAPKRVPYWEVLEALRTVLWSAHHPTESQDTVDVAPGGSAHG